MKDKEHEVNSNTGVPHKEQMLDYWIVSRFLQT